MIYFFISQLKLFCCPFICYIEGTYYLFNNSSTLFMFKFPSKSMPTDLSSTHKKKPCEFLFVSKESILFMRS